MKCHRLLIAGIAAIAPCIAQAQTATSCVNQTWAAFREEVESKPDPLIETGQAYLVAYGWVRATEACLSVATYPPAKATEAEQFRQAVGFTAQAIEQAIRTNTAPVIFGVTSGGGGVEPTYPDGPPSPGPLSGIIGEIRIPNANGGDTATQGASRPGGSDVGFRMLSMREWRALQARLTRLGFDTGGVDGIPGERTYAAIARYQRSLGERPTGLLSSRQIDALLN